MMAPISFDILLSNVYLICKNHFYLLVFYILVAAYYYKFTNQKLIWSPDSFLDYLLPKKFVEKTHSK